MAYLQVDCDPTYQGETLNIHADADLGLDSGELSAEVTLAADGEEICISLTSEQKEKGGVATDEWSVSVDAMGQDAFRCSGSSEWDTASGALETKVLPAFRPDRAVNVEKPDFVDYIANLSQASGVPITGWESLTAALDERMDFFADHGCRISDHGLENLWFLPTAETELDSILKRRLAGESLTGQELWQYKSALLCFFARGYAKRDWAMQLHFSAQRDNDRRMFRQLGPDTGYDCIGPGVNLPDLARFLNALEETGELPRTVLYSLEPGDNAALVSLMGCFQGPGTAGKLQHGSAWWFNDHRFGMEAQLSNLAAGGLLGNFIGMLTDSRSFLSYTRHEYFRRILCGLLGRWVEHGEFPDDRPALERLTADIAYRNSIRYFGFEQYHLRGADTV